MTGLNREEQGSSTLVPPAPRRVSLHVATAMLGTDEPLTTPLLGHGPAATRRRYTRALTVPVLLSVALVVAVLLTDLPAPCSRSHRSSCWPPSGSATTEPRSGARPSPRPTWSHVLQGARGQPRRDRDPGLPRGLRARVRARWRSSPRGPLVRAPAEGRRGLRDRRARPPGPRPTSTPRRSSRWPCGPGPTRSTRATASSRRTPRSPRPAPTPASPSSARAPTC